MVFAPGRLIFGGKFRKRQECVARAKDDVVDDVHIESFREILQFRSRHNIGFAWREVAGRMIVRDDDFLRIRLKRRPENRARINRRRSVFVFASLQNLPRA